jgi:hypothetical protein
MSISPLEVQKRLRQPLPENATDFDIIKQAVLTGGKLNKRLNERFEEYLFIHGMLLKGYTTTQVKEAFIANYNVRQTVAYERIQDAKTLLGDTQATQKEVLRIIMTERLQIMAQTARASQDLELELAIMQQLTKVNGLQHLDAPNVLDPAATELPKMQFEFNFVQPSEKPKKRIDIEEADTDE